MVMANKHFEEGGMRLCYKMYEIGQDGVYSPIVAKVFKDDVTDDEEVPVGLTRSAGAVCTCSFSRSLLCCFAGTHEGLFR